MTEPTTAAGRAWRAMRDDITRLAHLTPDDWAGRRGADRIARTINAARDIVLEHQPIIQAAIEAEARAAALDEARAAVEATVEKGYFRLMTDRALAAIDVLREGRR